jgi:hypothetical protein
MRLDWRSTAWTYRVRGVRRPESSTGWNTLPKLCSLVPISGITSSHGPRNQRVRRAPLEKRNQQLRRLERLAQADTVHHMQGAVGVPHLVLACHAGGHRPVGVQDLLDFGERNLPRGGLCTPPASHRWSEAWCQRRCCPLRRCRGWRIMIDREGRWSWH